MQYWLMKSEPGEYAIADLKQEQVAMWDGVRNYQVRNMMRDEMAVGDQALFYHSNAGSDTGVAGVMRIAKAAYADPTQFDPNDEHYDPKSERENPRWLCVDVQFVEELSRLVPLSEIKEKKTLAAMPLVKKGNRLSVMRLTKQQFEQIVRMGK